MQRNISSAVLVLSNVLCSTKEYRKALGKWKTKKNMSATVKNRMIGIQRMRKKRGKETFFLYNREPYALEKLLRHIRDENFSEDVLNSLELCSEGN